MLGRDRDAVAEAERVGSSTDDGADRGPRPCWRPAAPAGPAGAAIAAKCPSAGVTPARASTTNSTRSASDDRALGRTARMRPARRLGRALPPARRCRPAGPRGRAACASASLRSRVTPGVSATSALRRPASRLNSVDLPTFGRPAMTTTGSMRCQRTPVSVAVVGHHEQRAAGDDRGERGGVGQPLLAQDSCPVTGSGETGLVWSVPTTISRPPAMHRAAPDDRVVLLVRVLPARQVGAPSGRAPSSRVERRRAPGSSVDDEHPVAGDPGRVAAADLALPQAPAGAQVERDHQAADARSRTPGCGRSPAGRGPRRCRRALRPRDRGEAVGPDQRAAVAAQRHEVARAEAGDHEPSA